MKYWLVVLLFVPLLLAQDWKSYPYLPPGGTIAFPVDEGNHSQYGGSLGQGMEWWYLNFHLQSVTTGRHYSAMVTYFDFFLYPRIINVADEDQHLFHSFTSTGILNASVDSLNLTYLSTTGDVDFFRNLRDSTGMRPFQYQLQAGAGDYQLNLTLDLQKRPLLIGQNGLIYFSTGSSYYYSLTYLAVQGNIVFAGITDTVQGVAWMDHQYGPFFVQPGAGDSYEWFSVQLSNGVDICFWNAFTPQNTIPTDDQHRLSTLYLDDFHQDTTSQFRIERQKFWQYEPNAYFASQFVYADSIHDLYLTITPVFQEQVVPFINLSYFWEGSCTVSGTYQGNPVTGMAFAELLHIYREPQIELISPNGGEVVTDSIRIHWTLQNPDDGNPLRYDLFYSPDSGANFYPLVSGLTDTTFWWDVNGFPAGQGYLLSVVGYSVDSTIVGADTSDGFFRVEGSSALTSHSVVTKRFLLHGFYPNPFNNRLTIAITLPRNSRFSFAVYDVLGRLVYRSSVAQLSAGKHRLFWDGRDMSGREVGSGVYLVKLTGGGAQVVRKVMLVR